MILVFAHNDQYILDNAYNHSKTTYGIGYYYRKNHSYDKAKKNEDIFITAHGNNYVIGVLSNNFYVTASELAKILYDTFLPGNYQGNIYIFSCNSAPVYHKNFKKELLNLHNNYQGDVYGCDEKVSYPIHNPNSNKWQKA